MKLDPITEYIIYKDEIQVFNELLAKDYENIDTLIEGFINSAKVEEAKKAFAKNIKTVKQILMDRGVSLDNLKAQAKKAVGIIKSGAKQNRTPKEVSNDVIYKVISPTIKKAVTGAKYEDIEKQEPTILNKIVMSIAILACVVLAQQILLGWFALGGSLFLSGSSLKGFIVLVLTLVIAPITEEFGKRLAITQKYPWVYTGIFAGSEAVLYIIQMVAAGASLPASIIARGVGVLLHFTTAYIQKYFIDKVEAGDMDESWRYISFVIAVVLHSLFNFFAIIYGKELTSFLMR